MLSPPPGLGPRGVRYWQRVNADYSLNVSEVELLVEVARLLDQIDALHALVERDGATVAGSRGQPVLHPGLGELRGSRLALGRLLGQLALPDEDGDALLSPLQARGRRGARSRWADQRTGSGKA